MYVDLYLLSIILYFIRCLEKGEYQIDRTFSIIGFVAGLSTEYGLNTVCNFHSIGYYFLTNFLEDFIRSACYL